MSSYFWDPPGKEVGLNADLERHRRHEAELDEKILALEGKEGEFDQFTLAAYRHLRAQLLQSKAEVVAKLGRK